MSKQDELTLRLENQKKELEVELVNIQKKLPKGSVKRKQELERSIKILSNHLNSAKEEVSESVAKKFNDGPV